MPCSQIETATSSVIGYLKSKTAKNPNKTHARIPARANRSLRYTSRAALDAHRNSVPATSFGGQVFSVCDKERMRVMELEYQPGCRSDGREILNQKVPPFICAQLGVGATKLQQGVLAAVRDEALMHGVLRDTHDENRSVIIHVAKSEAAGGPFEEALDALTKQGVCHEVTRLTKLQGFLYR